MGRTLAYFPLVGLILGLLTAGLAWAAGDLWPPAAIGLLAVIWLAFLTRGLHLDGLADTADAIGSNAPRERALEIMKDSRTGAYGAVALVLVLLAKSRGFELLAEIEAWEAFILVPCLSRWGLCVLAVSSQYARADGGLGKAFVGAQNQWTLGISGPTALCAAWVLAGPVIAAWAVLGVGLLSLLCSAYFRRRLGGVTGDVLGAHVEVLEAVLVLAAYACAGGGGGI